jgi:hypothetical protein
MPTTRPSSPAARSIDATWPPSAGPWTGGGRSPCATGARGDLTRRTVHPLGLFHWGHAWTLAAWCELRQGHRSFRLDRIEEATTLPGSFPDEPPSTLEAFLATVRQEEG